MDLGVHGGGEFKTWTPEDRRAFVERATDIILDPTIMAAPYAVASTVVVDDWQQAGSGWHPTPKELYVFCYRMLFLQVLQRPQVQAGLEMVFDQRKGVQGDVQAHFAEAKNTLNHDYEAGFLESCKFEDDRVVLPLQAADYLAGEVRGEVVRTIRNPDRKPNKSFERLVERQHSFRRYDRRFMQALVEEIKTTGKSLHKAWVTVDFEEL